MHTIYKLQGQIRWAEGKGYMCVCVCGGGGGGGGLVCLLSTKHFFLNQESASETLFMWIWYKFEFLCEYRPKK